ncbi:MAG TPA: response regulator [Candidatus Solibacter sp.]|nr:response regulator [Candidatus Solibacter sp.]
MASSASREVAIAGLSSKSAVHPVVLVVEDLESLRQSILDILEEAEFLVLPAEDADQALELAQSCAGPIHLLITKLHPAGMAGPDLAFHLRKRSPEMSVLYSSACPLAALDIPDPTEVIASMLPRPFSKARLLGRINTLLATHT